MKAAELRNKFIEFFTSLPQDHKEIPSASLVPEDDPTILFTPAGMSPLVRYLMGEAHPLGKRLCSIQKCLRTDDIEEVGDLTHFTFFEMLGNWSLGDYFKKEAIYWSFEFLTSKKWLGLDPKRIYVTVFKGDKDAPMDKDSMKSWQEVFRKVGIKAEVGDWKRPTFKKGVLQERIFTYSKKENWWGPAGQTGPCGPDTEMFYDTGLPHREKFGRHCHPNCDCGRFFEIWNNVFMEFNKKADDSFEPLKQKNVDTGMGLERVVALTEFLDGKISTPDPFLTELFTSMIRIIEAVSGKKYEDYPKEFRIICDHLRAAVFVIADGIEPSNKDRGYVLRRLLRRTYDNIYGQYSPQSKTTTTTSDQKWGIIEGVISETISLYGKEENYKFLEKKRAQIIKIVHKEIESYGRLITATTTSLLTHKCISGREAFKFYSTYGISPAQLKTKGYIFDEKEFEQEKKKHQELSRAGGEQKFAGGLQDHSEKTTKLHTTTHLLHAALRKVLGEHVQQVGSNITAERLRFDFTHPRGLTKEQINKVEDLVNEQIKKNLPVKCETMSLNEAQKKGALAFFGQRYPEKVKVYFIGDFSKEVCGGPHVGFTGEIGRFKIVKEKAVGEGKRRVYAIVSVCPNENK